jgi:phosphoribosylformimino-5-aminoimidazole carboxamide ribotide isomerase
VRQVRDQTSLRIQTGGGIRNADDVAFLLDAGVERVVVGTLAVREPDLVSSWLGSFGADRITVALDARQDDAGEWRLPVKGWTEVTTGTLEEFLDLYAGAGLRHVLVTDISRDGMLSGFATDLYSSLAKSFPAIELQASGGVRTLDDIRDAKAAGARAAILGRALLEKRFTLKEALTC